MKVKLDAHQLILKYQELPDKEKIDILFEAIVKQKMYPDKSRYDCIFMMMDILMTIIDSGLKTHNHENTK